MRIKIIDIGNSKGIRIPKALREEAGLEGDVEISAKRGEIKIVPAKNSSETDPFIKGAEEVFARDWLRPEEEEAWKIYQSDK